MGAMAQDIDDHPIAAKPIRLTLVNTITGQEDTAHALWPESIPLLAFWRIYDALHQIDLPAATAFVELGLYMAGERQHDPDNDEIMDILNAFSHLKQGRHYSKRSDRLLSLTYSLLNSEQLTYAEAATFASLILEDGKKSINPDTWRIRIARWAKEEGLPPLQLKRGRPRRENPNI
jgi:hypothetical protein